MYSVFTKHYLVCAKAELDNFYHLGPVSAVQLLVNTARLKDITKDDIITSGLHPETSASQKGEANLTLHALAYSVIVLFMMILHGQVNL